MSDDELVILLRDTQQREAFNEIYNRYWEKIYYAVKGRVREEGVPEEIVQDIFTDFWFRCASIEVTSKLSAYFMAAARYKVINHIHREALKNNYSYVLAQAVHDYDNTTEEVLVANDLMDNIRKQIDLLPERCRLVFELSRDEYKSNKEIAHSLGISEKTVENQITKALRKLRTSLGTLLF